MTAKLPGVLVALAILSACSPEPAPTYPSAPATAASLPALDWHTWLEGRDLFVQLSDPSDHYETVTMELIAPGGQAIPASAVTREEHVYRDRYGRPTVGVGGAAGSRGGGMGVGVSVPLGGSGSYREEDERTIVGRFVIPDLYHYRATAGDWHIALSLTSRSGEASRATIPAPVP